MTSTFSRGAGRPRAARVEWTRAAFGIAFFVASGARAGNLDAFYLSGDAGLQAGAITADARGGGAVWYNPSGLAELKGLRLDVSVNGYALRFGGAADFDAGASSRVTRLSRLDLNVVPTALTLTQTFGDVGVGFGVFVPTQSTTVLRTQVDTTDPSTGERTRFGWDSYSRYQEYHVGPGFGFRLLERLQLGAAFLVNYRTQLSLTNLDAGGESNDATEAVAVHTNVDVQQVGAEFVLGGQWQIDDDYRLGVTVRTPAIRLYQIAQVIQNQVTAVEGGEVTQEISSAEQQGIDAQVLTPFRFHVGLSRTFGASRAAVEANLLLPYTSDDAALEQRLTWNVRAGLKTRASREWTIGGGLFTDRSSVARLENFGDSRIDYYGATFAVDWVTPYGIYSKGSEVFARPRTLLFGTTVALSYAIGVGSVMRGTFETGESGSALNFVRADAMAHEFTLHIGSTFSE